MESGWLDRQLRKAAQDVKAWPAWLRQEAGIEPKPALTGNLPEENMMNKVYTESKCYRCDTVRTEDGASGGLPPVGWSMITCSTRLAGSGWTNSVRPLGSHSILLCDDCTKVIVQVAKQVGYHPTPTKRKMGCLDCSPSTQKGV